MRRGKLLNDISEYQIDDLTGDGLFKPEAQSSEENRQVAAADKESDLVIKPETTPYINKSTSNYDTLGNVSKLKKLFNSSKRNRRKLPTESSEVNDHAPCTAAKHHFCTLSKSDKKSLRAQLSIWCPCIFHKPTLKAWREALIRMKNNVVQELRKIDVVCFNKQITESTRQRNLFREENLRERCSKQKPVWFISNVVPECQKQISSLAAGSNGSSSLTSPCSVRKRKATDCTMVTESKQGICTVVGGEPHWKSSFTDLDCDLSQMATRINISRNIVDCTQINPRKTVKTKQGSLPEWFQSMLRKEVIINIHPGCPSEQKGPFDEIKDLFVYQRRLQLGRFFHNADFSCNNTCLLLSVREQEEATDCPNKSIYRQSLSSGPCVMQEEATFRLGKRREKMIGPELPMMLNNTEVSNASPGTEDNHWQTNLGNWEGSFRQSFRHRHLCTTSNQRRDSSRLLSINTGNTQDSLAQCHSRMNSTGFKQSELEDNDTLKASRDQSRPWKDLVSEQSQKSDKDLGPTRIPINRVTASPTSQEIIDTSVRGRIANILPLSTNRERKTAEELEDYNPDSLGSMTRGINKKIPENANVFLEQTILDNTNTSVGRRSRKKEDVCRVDIRSTPEFQQRDVCWEISKCDTLSGNMKHEGELVRRELQSKVPISEVNVTEANTLTIDVATAWAQKLKRAAVDGRIRCLVNDTNASNKTCSTRNKTTSKLKVKPEKEAGKIYKDSSFVYVKGDAECSKAITVNGAPSFLECHVTYGNGSRMDHVDWLKSAKNTNPKSKKTSCGIRLIVEQKAEADTINKSNSSVHGAPNVLDCSQTILVDDVMGSQELCMNCASESEVGRSVLATLDSNSDTCVGNEAFSAINVSKPHSLCMVGDTEFHLDQRLVELDANTDPRNAEEVSVIRSVTDTEERYLGSSFEPKLGRAEMISQDADIEPIANSEFIVIDEAIQPQKLYLGKGVGSNMNPIIAIDLCSKTDPKMMNKIQEVAFQNHKPMPSLNEEHDFTQAQIEKDTYSNYLDYETKYCFKNKSCGIRINSLKASLDTSAKLAEPEPTCGPHQDGYCRKNTNQQNEYGDSLFGIRGPKSQRSNSEYNFEESRLSKVDGRSTYAASTNNIISPQKDSLVNFIREQWGLCISNRTGLYVHEQDKQPGNKHVGVCDISLSSPQLAPQLTSTASCCGGQPLHEPAVDGNKHRKPHSVNKEQSYQTMCSERWKNYLKICQTVDNYYKSISPGNSNELNSSSSLATINPQTKQCLTYSSRKCPSFETPENVLPLTATTGKLSISSAVNITKMAAVNGSSTGFCNFGYNKYYLGNSERKLVNFKQTSPQFCNSITNKLACEKVVPEVPLTIQGHGIPSSLQKNAQIKSSRVNQDTNKNGLLVMKGPVTFPAAGTNGKYCMGGLTSRLLTGTDRRCEGVRVLRSLDKLLEHYFRSIETLEKQLQNCYTRASTKDQRSKTTHKGESHPRNTRYKTQLESDYAWNLYYGAGYEGKDRKKMKSRQTMKEIVHNCSVNNTQDTPPSSVPSDSAPAQKDRLSEIKETNENDAVLGGFLNPEEDVTINNGLQPVTEDTGEFPDDTFLVSPDEDELPVLPVEKPPTPPRGSRTSSKLEISKQSSPKLQRTEKSPSVDLNAMPRLLSHPSITSGHSAIQQSPPRASASRLSGHIPVSPRASTSRLSGHIPVSPRASTSRLGGHISVSDQTKRDYYTQDIGNSAPFNHGSEFERRTMSISDTDANYRSAFLRDNPIRRMRKTETQEFRKLQTIEQEYDPQLINSQRHTAHGRAEYVDPEWPRDSSKYDQYTSPSGKMFSANADSHGYYNSPHIPRELPERRDFNGKSRILPTYESKIPDYWRGEVKGLPQQTNMPSVSPRRVPIQTFTTDQEKRSKKDDPDPCKLTQTQMWFRDLCEKVSTQSRLTGVCREHSRHVREDTTCDGNFRINANICVTPTICCPVDECPDKRHPTFAVKDVCNPSSTKENRNPLGTLEVDNRLLDPSKNYHDIALLQNSYKLDSNTRKRSGLRHRDYSKLAEDIDAVNDRTGISPGAVLESLRPLRQRGNPLNTSVGTQFGMSGIEKLYVKEPRAVIQQSGFQNTKDIASAYIQTCACISKPNGTCLCGYVAVNDTIASNKANDFLSPTNVRSKKPFVNVRNVCIQTCDRVCDEPRMKANPYQNGENLGARARLQKYSPIKIKYRNKKCQIGRCFSSKNEHTSIGASLSNDLPGQTLPTHYQHYDRKAEKNMVTCITKCVQTCSFPETGNSKLPSREREAVCSKCKQPLANVTIKNFESSDLSSENDSYEIDQDKNGRCDICPHCIMPILDPTVELVNVYPQTNYQGKRPYVQECVCKSEQDSSTLTPEDIEDYSDYDEWMLDKERQASEHIRYPPNQDSRLPRFATDSSNACVLSQELTEQISGIIQNSKLLQQQALQLRNKCKYLEGQGWPSINQNKHDAVRPRRFLTGAKTRRRHHVNQKLVTFMDKNNNASKYSQQCFKKKRATFIGNNKNAKMDTQEYFNNTFDVLVDTINKANNDFTQSRKEKNKTKYNNWNYSTYIASTTGRNDDLKRNVWSFYQTFIRRCLGYNRQLYLNEYGHSITGSANLNWNAKPRNLLEDKNDAASGQPYVYTHPQNERYFINDPSEEAYQYLNVHFPNIYRGHLSKSHTSLAAFTQEQGNSSRNDMQDRGYIDRGLLCRKYSLRGQIPEGEISLEKQSCRLKENVNAKTRVSNYDGKIKTQTGTQKDENKAIEPRYEEHVFHMRKTNVNKNIHSAYDGVRVGRYNKFTQSLNHVDDLSMSPVNVSYSASALKTNYWQLAYRIDSLSGNRQPAIHANRRLTHESNQINRQRHLAASDNKSNSFVRRDSEISRAPNKVSTGSGTHHDKHLAAAMISCLHLHLQGNSPLQGHKTDLASPTPDCGCAGNSPLQEHTIDLASPTPDCGCAGNSPLQEHTTDLASAASVCGDAYSWKITDASDECLSSPQAFLPDTSLSQPCKDNTCPRAKNSPAQYFQAKEKSHDAHHKHGDIPHCCDSCQYAIDGVRLQDTETQTDGHSPAEYVPTVSLISVTVTLSAAEGGNEIIDAPLNIVASEDVDIHRNKSSSEQVGLDRGTAQIQNTRAVYSQGSHQQQVEKMAECNQSPSSKDCESELCPVSACTSILGETHLACPRIEQFNNQKHNEGALNSQGSSHGIEDLPLDSVLSAGETIGYESVNVSSHKRSEDTLNTKIAVTEGVLYSTSLPVKKRNKRRVVLTGPKENPTPSTYEATMLLEDRGITNDKNDVRSSVFVKRLQPTRLRKQGDRGVERKGITLNGDLNRPDVILPSYDYAGSGSHVWMDGGPMQDVMWWKSPEFIQESEILKSKDKITAVDSMAPVRSQNTTTGSKKSKSTLNKIGIARPPCLGLYGHGYKTTVSSLNSLCNTRALRSMSSDGHTNLSHNPKHGLLPSYTGKEYKSRKWRTCFVGCAEVIQTNDEMVCIEGAYILGRNALFGKREDVLTCETCINNLERERSKRAGMGSHVIQFQLTLFTQPDVSDSAVVSGIYSRQLLNSNNYFNWECIF